MKGCRSSFGFQTTFTGNCELMHNPFLLEFDSVGLDDIVVQGDYRLKCKSRELENEFQVLVLLGGCGMTEEKEDKHKRYRDELFQNITSLIQKQGDALECVYLRYAAFRDESYDKPQLIYLNLKFGKEIDEDLESATSDWGPLVVNKRTIKIDDAMKALEKIIMTGIFSIESIENSDVDIMLNIKPDLITSNISDMPGNWPFHKYILPVRHIQKQLPNKLPILVGRPYYPTLNDAIGSLLEIRHRLGNLDGIEITIPDYRAKIENLHIGDGYVVIDVTTGTQSEEALVTKVYLTGDSHSIGSNDIRIKNGKATFRTKIEPEYVSAVLLSHPQGEVIDTRIFSSFGLLDKIGPVYDDFEHQILELINRGEGPRIEFKLRLNQDKKREYMETIVAFANSRGGYLFLGVNDNGDIIGTNEEVEEILRNQIHSLCNPSIDITVRENVELEGVKITVIQVPEGQQKPYFLQGRGYIRLGSTDRIMKREELEKMFNSDKPIYSTYLDPYFSRF